MYANIIEAINNLKSLMEGRTNDINDRLDNIETELKLTRKGNEAFVYGEEVEDSDEVDLEEVPLKEGE